MAHPVTLGAASWNPLRCRGGALPTPYILIGKLLIVYVAFSRSPGGSHTIAPILPWLEYVPAADGIRFTLRLGIVFAAFAILANRWFQPACLYIGASALTIILWSRLNYSNNQVLVAMLLLLLGLSDPKHPGWGIRATVILVYFGAGLNKLLDPDWQSGRFMEHFFGQHLEVAWYHLAAESFGPGWVDRVLAWGTILTELTAAALLARPRTAGLGVLLGASFHALMLVSTGGALSHRFMYLMPVAYLAFLPWPQSGTWTCQTRPAIRRLLQPIDLDRQFRWEAAPRECVWFALDRPDRTRLIGLPAAIFVTTRLPALWLAVGALYAGWIFL